MRKFASILTLVVISMLLAAACAPQSAPTPTPVEPTPGGQQTVTLEDQGKTIHLAVGERFLLQLGDTYTWDVTISDQNVVSRVIGITVVRGAQGVYEAHQAGTATLSATGDPACRQAQPPCEMPSILFEITLTVE